MPLVRILLKAGRSVEQRRTIADCVPVATLQLTPEAVADHQGSWRDLLDLPVRH